MWPHTSVYCHLTCSRASCQAFSCLSRKDTHASWMPGFKAADCVLIILSKPVVLEGTRYLCGATEWNPKGLLQDELNNSLGFTEVHFHWLQDMFRPQLTCAQLEVLLDNSIFNKNPLPAFRYKKSCNQSPFTWIFDL